MNILGIIAEYNPFHNGHLYQLKKSVAMTEADFVVVIMSGNFTQRGEPTIFSKWDRARLAVECGVDLVIELPFVFACNNAEYFAKGAIEILNGLGCITHLSFGSEVGDLTQLNKIAELVSFETEEFKEILKQHLDSGLSYPTSRGEAIKHCLGEEVSNIINNPNNILAIEYLKQLKLTNSDIIPVTVKRFASEYNDTSLKGNIASATAIRTALFSRNLNTTADEEHNISDFIPADCLETFLKLKEINELSSAKYKYQEDLYFKLISLKVLTANRTSLNQIFSINEGLENKLKTAVRTSDTLMALREAIKSKRYTLTRINRLLTHTLLGLTTDNFNMILESNQCYARILAFNLKGAKLLKHIKKSEKASLPIITNINKEKDQLVDCQLLLSYDLMSTDIYNLINQNSIYSCSDQISKPYFKKD
ncbi:MAG: nucleotidyltransferase [Aminipila sp.]